MSRLDGEKDGGEIMLIDKQMVWDIVFHKHNFWFNLIFQQSVPSFSGCVLVKLT